MVTSGIRYDTSGIRIKFCRYQVSEVRYQVPTQVSESCNPGFSYTCTCTVSDPGTGIPGTCIYTYTWSCSTSKHQDKWSWTSATCRKLRTGIIYLMEPTLGRTLVTSRTLAAGAAALPRVERVTGAIGSPRRTLLGIISNLK